MRSLRSAFAVLLVALATIALGAAWASAQSPESPRLLQRHQVTGASAIAQRVAVGPRSSPLRRKGHGGRETSPTQTAIAAQPQASKASPAPAAGTSPGSGGSGALPPIQPPSTGTHCFASPHTCGYPDETNTGATGTLTPSGSITASTNGQTIEGKDVTGQITINASNVTLRNVRVTATAAGNGSAAVTIAAGKTGVRIEDTTVRGKGTGSQVLESAVRNLAGSDVLALRDQFTNCADCWEGEGTFRDTYMRIDSIFSGAHAEDIYVCSGRVDVGHSTLLNNQPQTATVFGDTICGGGNQFEVTNSLLSGGGYTLYTQANGSNPPGASTTVTGNRFSRCLTAPKYNSSSGGTACQGGADSNGYWPGGGYFGVGAYFSGPLTWSENVWDDNLATVPEP